VELFTLGERYSNMRVSLDACYGVNNVIDSHHAANLERSKGDKIGRLYVRGLNSSVEREGYGKEKCESSPLCYTS